jgi:nucleotide-binding universal stress UspA family protein
MFKSILTATDLLDASDGAVTSAIELCRRNAARLLLLHVLESSYSGIFRQFVKEINTGKERVVSKEYEVATKKALAAKWAPTLGPYMKHQIEITAGVPWIEILRAARKARADLVVLGSHGKGAEEKGVMRRTGTVGSTVEGVVMGANCPVLIVNRTIEEEKLAFRNVMVCVDFSRSCEYAIRFAGKLAAVYDSRLLLLHVIRVTPFAQYFQAGIEEEKSRVNERLRNYGKDLAEGTECRSDLREGKLPYTVILDCASENGVDLIVMGSHTRADPEKWHVGSTVHEVSTRSNCPIAVVTHPQALWKMDESQLHVDSERRRNDDRQHFERP